jgi:hypothetical protein
LITHDRQLGRAKKKSIRVVWYQRLNAFYFKRGGQCKLAVPQVRVNQAINPAHEQK